MPDDEAHRIELLIQWHTAAFQPATNLLDVSVDGVGTDCAVEGSVAGAA